MEIKHYYISQRLDGLTAGNVFDQVDVILDCSDSILTRKVINHAALKFAVPWVLVGFPLVYPPYGMGGRPAVVPTVGLLCVGLSVGGVCRPCCLVAAFLFFALVVVPSVAAACAAKPLVSPPYDVLRVTLHAVVTVADTGAGGVLVIFHGCV